MILSNQLDKIRNYNVIAGMHTGDVLPEAEAKKLRAQIDSLKWLDSTFTDEEALEMLHDILGPMVVRYGIHKKEESVRILIKARKLMREQGLEKWDAVDKVVEQEKEKGRINFFYPDFTSCDNTCYNGSFQREKPNLMFVNLRITRSQP